MILAFVGTPGSGKTYEAVQRILENLMKGRVIYTNIEGIFDPACQEMQKMLTGLGDYGLARLLKPIDNDQIHEFWEHVEPNAYIVLDEIHKHFSNREWQSKQNKQFGFWASTHRHYGYDVLLITQSMERVDAAIRPLLEWTYVFKKINYFGSWINNSYTCYAYTCDDINAKPVQQDNRSYNKKIFLCYKSYVSKDTKELGIMSHANALNHPVFYAIPIIFAIVLYLAFGKSSLATGDLFGSKRAIHYQDQKKTKNKSYLAEEKAPQPTSPSLYQVDANGRITVSNRQVKP